MAKGRITIAAIAEELGVSVPTISRVLNGKEDVAESTRVRVEEALTRHNYRKPVAANSTSRSSDLLDLVFHEAGSGWAHEIIQGVEYAAGPEHIGVVLSQLGGSHRPSKEWLDSIMARRSIGVVLVLSGLDESQRHQLDARSIPYVVIDAHGDPGLGVPTVGSNNWNGGLVATRHLISLGHKRIAVISGPSDVMCSRARVDGYRSAHDEAGLECDPALIRWGDFEKKAGYEHALELLQGPNRPTAIFAGSDYQALGVMRAARELGLLIPRDLSIVGYDDLPVTAWLTPPLTTVNQPLAKMAALATQMLISIARGETLASSRVELGIELIVRESTAPPQP
ncbi:MULTISPECIES: LacI family DNA-binding transcriptional regulator [unclassified Arthrobacter]|uniref:LacI family DNA-binding transcriptional regulator n=1 Tax=unclassified Arthrobacter TaxID=235627 RepID=UPI000CE2F318|nr:MULTISPECIES: LacI family DNA-binding transcriptional regulator [unclassified Arthrobacter]